MTADRPYRSSLADSAAADELRAGAGAQFDMQVVTVFLAALARQQAPALPQAS
jgi:HD-GYP domain-containing protein (c-di-GMP phosphodiesterase class II)